MPYFDAVKNLGRWRFGITHDLVLDNGEAYLERWILWCGFTLRVHKFHKGDDDRAFHDHPWWFITLPLRDYVETTPTQAQVRVRRFRPYFRPAAHQHIVRLDDGKPVWTLIITGAKSQQWGFWDKTQFVPHEQWLANRETLN
ncbi:MAG: hypothetical protein NXH95_08855 [Pseudomonadaceae bacterium]|nr:hypothetical protein [Pseudomonadaceae bacterium]